MIDIFARVKSEFSGAKFAKQAVFATAVALTNTAKDAQADVLDSLAQTFTLRGKWFAPSNKFGIKVKTARKDDLQSAVYTDADWLIPHETGEDKLPRGNSLAVPTENVRRSKKDFIIKSNRPRALQQGFILTSKKTGHKILFIRKGKKKRSYLVALYNLTTRVHIKKQSTVIEPIQKTVERNFYKNYEIALRRALETAK